jgi:hypothetical protein
MFVGVEVRQGTEIFRIPGHAIEQDDFMPGVEVVRFVQKTFDMSKPLHVRYTYEDGRVLQMVLCDEMIFGKISAL